MTHRRRRERRLLVGISKASLFQAVTTIICMHSTYMYLLLTAKQYYGWFHPEHHPSFFFRRGFVVGTPPHNRNLIAEPRWIFSVARFFLSLHKHKHGQDSQNDQPGGEPIEAAISQRAKRKGKQWHMYCIFTYIYPVRKRIPATLRHLKATLGAVQLGTSSACA